MARTTPAKNAMLNGGFDTAGLYASLHYANPDPNGTSEISGGGYTRQPLTWTPASEASKAASNQPAFSIPAGVTPTHVGLWTAVTGGEFWGGDPLPVPETFTGPGVYKLTSTIVVHD